MKFFDAPDEAEETKPVSAETNDFADNLVRLLSVWEDLEPIGDTITGEQVKFVSENILGKLEQQSPETVAKTVLMLTYYAYRYFKNLKEN